MSSGGAPTPSGPRELRERVFEAVKLVAFEAALQKGLPLEDQVILVQLRPFAARVLRRAADGRDFEMCCFVRERALPDRGVGIKSAVVDFIGELVTQLPDGTALHAVRYAQAVAGEGGFMVWCDPGQGVLRVYLVAPGATIGDPPPECIELGGIDSAPEVRH